VQAERAAAFPASIAAGMPVQLKEMNSIADGVSVGLPGALTFGVVSKPKWVDEILTVSEESICQAILRLLTRSKVVVEPAGSVACAALLQHSHVFASSPGPVVVTLSGGNIEPILLMRVMQHGLISYGRYITLQIRTKDKPGCLASILNVIAAKNANVSTHTCSPTQLRSLSRAPPHLSVQVLNVNHNRLDSTLPINEVDVFIELETRGTRALESKRQGCMIH
jgi:threonine dehydratase